MLPPSGRLGVAVSGGADSVCLLNLLRELVPGQPLAVLHVNHGLRGSESDGDEHFVRELADSFELPFFLDRPTLPPGNLEQEARRARYAFFHRLLAEGEVQRVATAHTQDDQAETVILRLIRGAGATGLRGVLPVTRAGIVRPLLQVSRAEIEAHLRRQNLPWRDDHTNSDPAFTRNRIRHCLLPQLERDYNHALRATLAHTAQVLLAEDAYLDSHTREHASQVLLNKDGAVLLDGAKARLLPEAIVRRLIRIAVERVRGDLRRLEWQHVEAVLALCLSKHGSGSIDLPGLRVERSFDWLRFAALIPPVSYEAPLVPDKRYGLPGGLGSVCLQTIDFSGNSYNGRSDCLALAGPLEVRNWRPGDRLDTGGTVPRKLKELFQQHRIPVWERRGWPVITNGETVVWTRKFGTAAFARPGREARTALRVSDD